MPKKKKGARQNVKKNVTKRQLEFKEDGQDYALVTRTLGNGRFTVHCYGGPERLAIIRGKMRKRVWVNNGDIILVGLRDFQDSKCDIMGKYTSDEARQLKAYGEIPEDAKINQDEQFNETDDLGFPFEFGDPDDEEEKDKEATVEGEDESKPVAVIDVNDI
jgi:translation initiation factor 1A